MVGYQLVPVQPGFVLFTPTFQGVGAQELDLTTIEICDSTGKVYEDMANEVGIQKMDDAGVYLDMFSYWPEFGGWNFDLEPLEKGDVTFKNGETICVNNDFGSTVYFKISGEVDLINLNKVGTGFVLWGNSTPVKIDITDVEVTDETGKVYEDMANEVGIQKMDDAGVYLDMFSYWPEFGGWNFDLEPLEKGDLTLEPGEAVCVNNDFGTEVYFKLPCPVKK